eukprot:3111542-Amphidinium_carterae.2
MKCQQHEGVILLPCSLASWLDGWLDEWTDGSAHGWSFLLIEETREGLAMLKQEACQSKSFLSL